MTECETQAALIATLELEVSRLRAVNAELRARVESTSLRQRADAWMAVCALLRELRPGWASGPGSAQEQALEAIRAMASQPARPPLTDAQVVIACSDFRRDFGRLTYREQEHLCFQAREWDRAIGKARGDA